MKVDDRKKTNDLASSSSSSSSYWLERRTNWQIRLIEPNLMRNNDRIDEKKTDLGSIRIELMRSFRKKRKENMAKSVKIRFFIHERHKSCWLYLRTTKTRRKKMIFRRSTTTDDEKEVKSQRISLVEIRWKSSFWLTEVNIDVDDEKSRLNLPEKDFPFQWFDVRTWEKDDR